MKDSNKYSNTLIKGKAKDVRNLRCPLCDSKIKAQWTADKTSGKSSGKLKCINCDWGKITCGIFKTPPWVIECGNKIED